ncbi:hypothetical protein Ancab_012268 [Ancistrocladus abbreviatus]
MRILLAVVPSDQMVLFKKSCRGFLSGLRWAWELGFKQIMVESDSACGVAMVQRMTSVDMLHHSFAIRDQAAALKSREPVDCLLGVHYLQTAPNGLMPLRTDDYREASQSRLISM